MKQLIILLKSHFSGIPGGPVDSFYNYFADKCTVYFVKHPLFHTPSMQSTIESKTKKVTFKIVSSLQWFLEGLSEIYFLKTNFPLLKKIDIVICFDPLSFINTYLLKPFYRIDKIIYYNLDYSKTRFKNKLLNFLYTHIDIFAFHNCNYFFSFSENYIQERDPEFLLRGKTFIVPNTVDLKKIEYREKIGNSLVYAGVINYPTIDFDPLLLALKKLQEEKNYFIFDIYGLDENNLLKKKIKDLSLSENVFIKGVVEHDTLVRKLLSQYCIGVCPYVMKEENTAPDHLYSGTNLPAKIVDYIAAGTPVLSTQINSKMAVLEDNKFGFIIKTSSDWYVFIKRFLEDSKLREDYGNNALRYAKNYDTEILLDKVFKKIL